MKKVLISLVMVGLMTIPSFAAVSTAHTPVGSSPCYNKTDSDVLASKTIWATSAINKRANVSDIIISSVADTVVTITDAETTPNTLLVLNVLAKSPTVISLQIPMKGSMPTIITVNASLKASATTSASITLIGWEK